mmetsp:Transcript_37894/g.107076  ORF Transcript_37894/g.107076 Transcript_37894/m.107076 type:complete len:167 (+) Transcript_37894:179-679(+)|eukprot:CAMPEP_0117675450 /NCGR_PEP_ID=MMETSP0804-20121206/15610_1 /TAXON_ID=1074897 /ORGANISM="Tetraselmis astigmatica, Strain CCMP880" /LENGTH=166 /DNA_ID=CAMNT_0005484451 /DNA_START=116 /DNA_END=616 /DNA_ORIENTATION=+
MMLALVTVTAAIAGAASHKWLRARQKARAKLPELRWLSGEVAVVRLPPGTDPAMFGIGPDTLRSEPFASVTHTAEETSVVLSAEHVPAGNSETVSVERGWICLKVQGPLDFSLLGILSLLSSTLAAAGVSIFAISTYDTDYILVKQESRAVATNALESKGYKVVDT